MSGGLFELAVPGGSVVGTTTDAVGTPRSVVVLAPNGPLPRSGGNRVYVRLAGRLSAAGHVVVRADLPGYGEAEGDVPQGSAGEHFRAIEDGRLVSSYAALLRAARGWHPDLPLVAYGACGGGLTALLAVAGGATADVVAASAFGVKRTNPARFAAATKSSGRGLATNASMALAPLQLRAAARRGARRGWLVGTGGWLNAPVLRSIVVLLDAGVPVEVLFGAEDPAVRQFEELVVRPFRLERRPGFGRSVLPGVAHLLEDPDDMDRLAAALDAAIGRAVGRLAAPRPASRSSRLGERYAGTRG